MAYDVVIAKHHPKDDEFEITGNSEHYYLTRSEVLVDILHGDMVLH